MTDKIIISRKEIDALKTYDCVTQDNDMGVGMWNVIAGKFITVSDLRALLDKAEVSEPVGEIKISWGSDTGYEYGLTLIGGALGSQKEYDEWIVKNFNGEGVFKLYTSPRDQSAKIAELEAEVARLKAIP